MHIFPALLTSQVHEFKEQLALSKRMQGVSTIQVDIIDGFFADNITISPVDIAELDYGELSIDFHFMVEDSYDYLHEIESNASFFPVRGIITQIERLHEPKQFLQHVKERGWLAGLSLNLDTPYDAIDEDVWEVLDIVQVMGIDAGFQGQNFNSRVLPLISHLRKHVQENNLPVEIIVDGGIDQHQLPKIIAAGASSAAIGSALWKSENPVETVMKLFELIHN